MDVKHVLYDTLSYLVLDDAIRLAEFREASSICLQIQAFHDENKKQVIKDRGVVLTFQTPDYVLRAFNNGSYSRVNLSVPVDVG